MESSRLDGILARAQRGDAAALASLVDAYANRVHGLLFRLTRNRHDAEELTQETFLRMVRTIEHYDHRGRFEAWLFRIASNLVRDDARRIGRRGQSQPLLGSDGAEGMDGGLDAPEGAHGPDRLLEAREREARLERALAELPEADREIVVLRHYSELPFQEIADLLEIPLGTALARAHRALAKLRAALGES